MTYFPIYNILQNRHVLIYIFMHEKFTSITCLHNCICINKELQDMLKSFNMFRVSANNSYFSFIKNMKLI